MRRFKRLAGLLANEKGNVLLIGAATMPLLIGSAALAVDTIQLSLVKRQLQRAADSAALAGAHAIVQNNSAGVAAAAVTRDLQLNNSVPINGTPVVQNAPQAGPGLNNNDAVRVVLSTTRTVPFMSFFTNSSVTLTAEATAAGVADGEFCLLALEDGPVTGIDLTGNAYMNLGCGMGTNARGAQAIAAGGSSEVYSTPLTAAGAIPASSHFKNNPDYLPFSPKLKDPFADRGANPGLEATGQDTCPAYDSGSGVAPVPGKCYSSMNFTTTVALSPGIYYSRGGNINLGSHARVSGDNVTFVLMKNASNQIGTFDMDGQAEIRISATTDPNSPYRGIAIYQEDFGQSVSSVKLNGGAVVAIEGALYFPRADLTFNGNSSFPVECFQMVARKLTFTGSMRVTNVCNRPGGPRALQGTFVRLIG